MHIQMCLNKVVIACACLELQNYLVTVFCGSLAGLTCIRPFYHSVTSEATLCIDTYNTLKIYLLISFLSLYCLTGSLKVVSSSAELGWMPTVSSNSVLVKPAFIATAKPCKQRCHFN